MFVLRDMVQTRFGHGALLKKQVGYEAVVQTPSGEVLWWINEIYYEKS